MDLTKFGKELEDQQGSFEKDYSNASGEKFSGMIKYTGSYVLKAKTVKYTKDGKVKQFPDIDQDKHGGFRCNIALEVVKPTENVPVKSTLYEGFPISSKSPDPKKRFNAANMCKGRMLAFAPKEIAESFKLNPQWLNDNILGEYEEKPDEGGDYKVKRETKLNDLVFIKLVQEVDQNGRPRLKAEEIRKATPEDISVEGKILEVVEVVEESSEQVVDDAPSFSSDNKAVDDAIDDFS